MSNNIPGINRRIQPGTIVRQRTLQRAAAAAGGARILCIIGEGEVEEVVIDSAQGGGSDGVNSDFSGSNNPTGRHFQLGSTSLIANRTSLLLNGAQLDVLEAQIDSNAFDNRYDARVDPNTGRVELQRAHLVSVGGTAGSPIYYTDFATNTGSGAPTLTSDSLVDTSAPAETWTLRVVSVVRDGYGDPISGEATFSVSGSTSGIIKDSDGNPIRWRSDGTTVSNGILSFSISEGVVPFEVGDRFTVEVDSQVLEQNDQLVARYIPTANLEDPELFLDPEALFDKHGQPSSSNTLSLGAQMAFENNAPAVLALQAKPPLPRKTSETLIAADNPLTDATEGASGAADIEDTIFPLDLGAMPDADTQINIFVVDSDGSETQLQLTKVDFYDTDYSTVASTYTGFVTDGSISQSYTVVQVPEVEQSGIDGYVLSPGGDTITFTSETASFSQDRVATGEGDVGKDLYFFDPTALAGASGSFAVYEITEVGDGYGDTTVVTATRSSGPALTGPTSFSDVIWHVVDPNDESVQFAITDDVAINNLTAGKGLRIEYIDQQDADFFDTNWSSALQELEASDCQIVVPLPTQAISNIFQATRSHVEAMSAPANARERITIIGAINGLDPDDLVGRTQAAVENIGILEGIQGDDAEEVLENNIEDLANYSVTDAFGGSFRTVYMAPDQIVRNINGTNTVLSGYFMAPALGGFLSGQGNVAIPPTFKILTGFSILRDRVYRQFTLDELADAGVLVVQPVAGGGRMLHGLTTSQSGIPEEEEVSIVAIRDQTSRALRNALRPFVGTVQSGTLIPAMTDTVSRTLDAMISQGLLASKGAISVARDDSEPRQINVRVQVAPTAPVNWVFIDVTFAI